VGGIGAVRYATSASAAPVGLPANPPSQGGDPLLGINTGSPGGTMLLLILGLLGGVLSIGLLLTDLSRWQTHHESRSRWIRRNPWRH
jgi:hypothetical protein